MNQPLITICITTYNRPQLTCELLGRLFHCPEVEYIVVDDGSTPGDFDILQAFVNAHSQSITLFRKDNEGKLSALLLGLKHAKGEYFTDLDSDDDMSEQNIKNIIEGIHQVAQLRAAGKEVIGVCGLSETPGGTITGDSFPSKLKVAPYVQMRLDHHIRGNKVEVVLTEKLRSIHISFSPGEKHMATNVLWFSLNDSPLLFVNQPFETYFPDRSDNLSGHLLTVHIQSCNNIRSYYKLIIQKKPYYRSIRQYLLALINYQRFSWHGARPFIENDLKTNEVMFQLLLIPFTFALYCRDLLKKD